MPSQTPKLDINGIHSKLTEAMPALENAILQVLFEIKDPAGKRKRGHEQRGDADKDLAQIVTDSINRTLKELVDINWVIEHVPESSRRYRVTRDDLARPSMQASTSIYPLLDGFVYPAAGRGNLTRALAAYQVKHGYKWEKVPSQVKAGFRANAATMINLRPPLTSGRAGSMPEVSVVRLFGEDTFSAYRLPGDIHSIGFRRDKEGAVTMLDPGDYSVDTGTALRLIVTNYLGSVAGDEFIPTLRRTMREYCRFMGQNIKLDLSTDGGEWVTAKDVVGCCLDRHQATGVVDVRFLVPNINPAMDATLLISDIIAPQHIVTTAGFLVQTTCEEDIFRLHNRANLAEPIDCMILAADLVDGRLGFDFREAILDGRLAMLQEFYAKEGKRALPASALIKADSLIYSFPNNLMQSLAEPGNKNMTRLTLDDAFVEHNKQGAECLSKGHLADAASQFRDTISELENIITDEMKSGGEETRTDYNTILQLRMLASAAYYNFAYVLRKLALEGKRPKKGQTADLTEIMLKSRQVNYASICPDDLMLLAKHALDKAVLYNPNDAHMLFEMGCLQRERGDYKAHNCDTDTVSLDEAGALRRARIYFRRALMQIGEDIKLLKKPEPNRQSAPEQELSALEMQRVKILSAYKDALFELVKHHKFLQHELVDISDKLEEYHVEYYDKLEAQAKAKGKSYPALRQGIEELCIGDRAKHAEVIQRVESIVVTSEPNLDERSIVILGSTELPNARMEKVLGSGGYGVVLEAVNLLDPNTRWAIKVMSPNQRSLSYIHSAGMTDPIQYAVEEYKKTKAALANHEDLQRYLVRVHNVEKCALTGRPIIVEDLMDGDFLALRKTWQSGVDEKAREFVLSLAKAVDAIHAVGLPHTDLSPSNILWRRNGDLVYKLCDLGLSVFDEGSGISSLSINAIHIRDPLGHKSEPYSADRYAFGCCVLYAYSNKEPFAPPGMPKPTEPNARREYEKVVLDMKRRLTGVNEKLDLLPSQLRDIVSTLIQPDAEKREIKSTPDLLKRITTAYG